MKQSRKNKRNNQTRPRIKFCPRCLKYIKTTGTNCSVCNCKKMYVSVRDDLTNMKDDIPYEDLVRALEYCKLNGYSIKYIESILPSAPKTGKPIPKDSERRIYALKKPKAERGNFFGIANHAGVSRHVHIVRG